MKIEILKGTVCGGKNVKKGDKVDASEQDAKILLRSGKAKLVDAKKDGKK